MKLLMPRAAFVLVLSLGMAACQPDAPPVDEPPEPQVAALADAMHDPLDKARAVEQTLHDAAQQQDAAVEAAAH